MKQNVSRIWKPLFISLFIVGIIIFSTPIAYADSSEINGENVDVGIGFENTQGELPKPSEPHNNTPTAGTPKPTGKEFSLPNTGEIVTRLAILAGGMILIVVAFVMILDKQIRVNTD